MPRYISAALWGLVSLNLITLVVGGLVTWLGYAIPMRLEQFGLRPETVMVSGFISLISACLGLCALNYSSYLTLGIYGAFCSLYVLVLLFGLPNSWYKSDRYHEGGLVLDIIYYSLIVTLLSLSVFAFIFAYYLKCKEDKRKSMPCTCGANNNHNHNNGSGNQLLTSSSNISNSLDRRSSNNNNNNNNNNNQNNSNLMQSHHLNLSSSSQELNLRDLYAPRISASYTRLSYPSRAPTRATLCNSSNHNTHGNHHATTRNHLMSANGAGQLHNRQTTASHHHHQQQQPQHYSQQQQQQQQKSSTIQGLIINSDSLNGLDSSNRMLLAGCQSSSPPLPASQTLQPHQPSSAPAQIKTIHGNMTMANNQQQQQHRHHNSNNNKTDSSLHLQQQDNSAQYCPNQQQQQQQITSTTMPRPRSASGHISGQSNKRSYCSSSVAAVTAAAAAALLGGVADGGAWIDSGHSHNNLIDSSGDYCETNCDFDQNAAASMPDTFHTTITRPDFMYQMQN